MASLWELFVVIQGDSSGHRKAFQSAGADLDTFSSKWETLDKKLALGTGLAAISAGAALAAKKFDDAAVQIQRSTGATGDKLKGLEDSFANVYKHTAVSSEAVTTTLSLLSTRTQATGKDLEDLTLKTINLAKTQKEDVAAIVPLVTRAFGDWSIAANQQGKSMDFLRVTSQQTGISVTKLSEEIVYAGAPLRMLGFNFDQAATLIAKFTKEGVNTELVLGGMKAALGKFQAEGITDTAKAWQDFVAGVKSGAISAAQVVKDVGIKRAPDLYKAIQEGRFEIDSMVTSSEKLASQSAKNVETLTEQFKELTHQLESFTSGWSGAIVAVGMLSPLIVSVSGVAIPAISGIIAKFATAEVAVVSLGSSTLALGGTFTTAGATIAAAGTVATAGWITLAAAIGAAAVVATAVGAGAYATAHFSDKYKTNPDTHTPSGGVFSGFGFTPDPGGNPNYHGEAMGPPEAAPAPPPTPPPPPSFTAAAVAALEIDNALAHQKALLEIKKSGYEEDEKYGRISAANNIARLQSVNAEELRITLDAISKKNALDYGTKDEQKAASFAGQRVAAIDKAAAQELIIEQKLEGAKEKIFDDTVKYHIQGLNASLSKQYKIEDDQVHYHIQSLNAGLAFDYRVRDHAAELNKLMEDDRVKAADEELKGAMEHQARLLELKRGQSDVDEKLGKITLAQKIYIDRSIDAEEEAFQRKAIQRELELLELKNGVDVEYASKHQALINKLQKLEDGHLANEQKTTIASLSVWGKWLAGMEKSVGSVERALQTLEQISIAAFDQFGKAMGANIAHAIIYASSVGRAMQAALAATLESLSAQSFAYAIFAGAIALLDLAIGDFSGAAAAAESAALFGVVGIVTAAMARALTPKQGAPSSAGGLGEVPYDGYQATLHKKETVLPADIAVPLRAQLRNGGVGGGGITINGPFYGVAKETVTLLANQMIRGARYAGARI